jgi:hypothetical protein
LPLSTKATHENQFTYFTNEVEKILLSVIIEEQHRAHVKNNHSHEEREIGGRRGGVEKYGMNLGIGRGVTDAPPSDTNSGGDVNSLDLNVD